MVDLEYLLKQEESEWLDFKQEWHKEKGHLIHDILSMLNSKSQREERFIVIGVRDDKAVIGVSKSDKKRKTEQQINNLIQNNYFNILPIINVIRLKYNEVDIDIISIRPKNAPYYLTKSYEWEEGNGGRVKNKYISAGSIYSRVGSNNTPLNTTTNESEIIDLWKKRFGLDLYPLERMNLYVKDYKNWVHSGDLETLMGGWYYKDFPEFKIEIANYEDGDFNEEWAKAFPDKNTCRHYIKLKYHETVLEYKLASTVDGGRYDVVLPDWVQLYRDGNSVRFEGKIGLTPSEDPSKSTRFFYKLKDSMDYHLDYIINLPESIEYFYDYFTDNAYNKKVYLFDREEDMFVKFEELYKRKNNIEN